MEPKPRIVTCPNCKGPSRYAPDNLYRPFCSERCRNMDLGAWASEQFRVGVGDRDEGDDIPPAPQPPH